MLEGERRTSFLEAKGLVFDNEDTEDGQSKERHISCVSAQQLEASPKALSVNDIEIMGPIPGDQEPATFKFE